MHISFYQENQDKLHKEIDQYQHELTALQSSYSQKISNLNKKHKQELQNWQDEKQEYLQRIEELEERLLKHTGMFVMSVFIWALALFLIIDCISFLSGVNFIF